MPRRRRERGNEPVYAWALWTPWGGTLSSTIRSTRSKAIGVYFQAQKWRIWKHKGWRCVRVEIKPIYFSSNSATMKKVP